MCISSPSYDVSPEENKRKDARKKVRKTAAVSKAGCPPICSFQREKFIPSVNP